MPIFAVIFAALFLGEPTGWQRWSAVLVGFLGVLLVLNPTTLIAQGFTGHHGFKRGMLRRALSAAGFGHLTVRRVLEVDKEVDGVSRTFGVFLATARKDAQRSEGTDA